MNEAPERITLDGFIDLIGEFGMEVHNLIDDCETSDDAEGRLVHEITDHGLGAVSDLLDRIEALPFEEPGLILGPGAMLQTALKALIAERERSAYESGRRDMRDLAVEAFKGRMQIVATLRALTTVKERARDAEGDEE